MQSGSNDISFSLFGFPTAIQPFFWLIAAFITAANIGSINNDMPIWILKLLLGMAGVLLSILVHELGHALTFRHLFRTPCSIVLHGFGGMAVPHHAHRRSGGFRGAVEECFLSFAGPLAGFILAFLMIILLQVVPADASLASSLLRFFLWWTVTISIFWGIFNLLPIYPMDGGHISREIFLFFSPWQGIKFSLILSMMLAALLAVLALRMGEVVLAFFFAYFAFQNYQEMQFRSF